ncbi:phosphate signaling complex protein PhoU [Chloroflexia bacterium SDU3-3]|nr:phosphate signaling complex protein PhoU [Chloroflexia bacterium SDU3-3]
MRTQYTWELESLRTQITTLGHTVADRLAQAILALQQHDTALAKMLIDADSEINAMRDTIAERVVAIIATQQPVAYDLRALIAASEIASELERVGDYAKSLAKITLGSPRQQASAMPMPLAPLVREVQAMLAEAIECFAMQDEIRARELESADDVVDALEAQFRAHVAEMHRDDPQSMLWATDALIAAHTLERIADRATNIAERVIFIASGERVELNH